MLNGYLRGSLKAQVDVVLSLFIVGLLILCGFLFGWKVAVASVLLCFVYGAVTKPIARRLAYRMLGHRTGFDSDRTEPLQDFSEGEISLEQLKGKLEKKEVARNQMLMMIASKPSIQAVLQENKKTIEYLEESNSFLLRGGLAEDLAEEIISKPDSLIKLIEMRDKDRSAIEVCAIFRKPEQFLT